LQKKLICVSESSALGTNESAQAGNFTNGDFEAGESAGWKTAGDIWSDEVAFSVLLALYQIMLLAVEVNLIIKKIIFKYSKNKLMRAKKNSLYSDLHLGLKQSIE
jgi:hypothetical protein